MPHRLENADASGYCSGSGTMYRIENTEYNAAKTEVMPVIEQACRYEHGYDNVEPERCGNVGHAKAYGSIWRCVRRLHEEEYTEAKGSAKQEAREDHSRPE